MLWSQSYETSVREIDEGTRELFSLMDDLMCEDAIGDPVELLDCLEESVRRHFQEEELLHEECEYPHAESHKRLHDTYIVTLRRVKRRIMEEGKTLNNMVAFNRAIVDGMRKHVLSSDKDFAHYYEEYKTLTV